MRTSEKHPKVRFLQKMTHFFVFFRIYFAQSSRQRFESYISFSIFFMRTSEKHPKVRFSRKLTRFFVFFQFFFAHVTFVRICNLMKKTASKSVNNFSSYKRTHIHTHITVLLTAIPYVTLRNFELFQGLLLQSMGDLPKKLSIYQSISPHSKGK